jgi:hypothetical protein
VSDAVFPKSVTLSTTGLIGVCVAILINTGMMYQQFQSMRDEQKSIAATVLMMRENQIGGLADIGHLKRLVDGHDIRIGIIENRASISKR